MTQNQIAYQNLQEAKRHNRVSEGVDIARAVLGPVSTAIGSAIPGGKYIIGGLR